MKSTKPKDCRTIKSGDLVEYRRAPIGPGGEFFYHVGLVLEREMSGVRFPIALIRFNDSFHGPAPVWIDCKDLQVFE